ncbi:MAG: fasciclin domain-containing protein [Rhodomicrobiaceae bacterium]
MTAAPQANPANNQDILQTAANNGSFKTLLAAVKAAGLNDTLKANGPITLFAPSDEAFKRLPEGTVDRWLKPENKAELIRTLNYHAVAGKITSGEFRGKKYNRKSVEGAELALDGTNGLMVNKAKVVTPDIAASNGVIQVIDSVLMPPKA